MLLLFDSEDRGSPFVTGASLCCDVFCSNVICDDEFVTTFCDEERSAVVGVVVTAGMSFSFVSGFFCPFSPTMAVFPGPSKLIIFNSLTGSGFFLSSETSSTSILTGSSTLASIFGFDSSHFVVAVHFDEASSLFNKVVVVVMATSFLSLVKRDAVVTFVTFATALDEEDGTTVDCCCFCVGCCCCCFCC